MPRRFRVFRLNTHNAMFHDNLKRASAAVDQTGAVPDGFAVGISASVHHRGLLRTGSGSKRQRNRTA